MTTKLYRKMMLEYLDSHIITVEEHDMIMAELKTIDQIDQRADIDHDVFHGEIYAVHAADLGDLLIDFTYDIYGRLYVANDKTVTADQYKAAVLHDNGKYLVYGLSDAVLETGYELVSDLYYDNDGSDSHAPDGTFKRTLPRPTNADRLDFDACHDQISNAAHYLQAYELTSDGYLEEDDAAKVRAAIEYLTELEQYIGN